MASALDYRIDRFYFIEFSPTPQRVGMQTIVTASSGTDGVSVWKDGERGMPGEYMTMVDASDMRDADSVVKRLKSRQGRIVDVWWRQVSFGKYLVQLCHPTVDEILKLVGGVRHANPRYVVNCRWILLPVEQ